MYHLAEAIAKEASGTTLVSGSAGNGIEIFLLECEARQRVYHTAGLGAMGNALPAAIGACLASGGGPTICVDGDGGGGVFLFTLTLLILLMLCRPLSILDVGEGT